MQRGWPDLASLGRDRVRMNELSRRVASLEEAQARRNKPGREEVIAALEKLPREVLRIASIGLLMGREAVWCDVRIEWDAARVRIMDSMTGQLLREQRRATKSGDGVEPEGCWHTTIALE